MNIGLITGFWSTNIGNAFFHLGADHLIRSCADNERDNVIWLNNMPAYWKLFNKVNPKNSCRGIGEPYLDVLVMVGPFLRKAFPEIWAKEIARLQAQGTKIVMIGLGAMQHDEDTRRVCREWFREYKPDYIATRDQATFEVLDNMGLNAEPVICPAFFVSEAIKKPSPSIAPYIVVNCEKVVEPFILENNKVSIDGKGTLINVDNTELSVKPKKLSDNAYLERFAELTINLRSFFTGSRLNEVGGVSVFRTIHRSNPFIFRNLFPQPNTMLSDVPNPYLLAYANANYVITDRVHTAVAAISYGTPVMFVGKTKRQGLLMAGGATINPNGIITVDNDRLEEKKRRLREVVATHVIGQASVNV